MTEWQQGQVVELEITDLSSTGEGVGRWQDRVVFVADTVPGDCIQVRLTRVKPSYGWGKLVKVINPSSQRVRPACIVADKCGGCQWQTVDYAAQLAAKQRHVVEALNRIGGLGEVIVKPILGAPEALGYRNKSTFPVVRSQSGQVKAGYYRKGSHQVVNLNQCPIQDERLNPLLEGIKQDIQTRGWSIYDEEKHRGKLRHLSLRIGRRTGAQLLTLVSTDVGLVGLEEQAQAWLETYPDLVGVAINCNRDRTNAIFGDVTTCVAGQSYLEESFAGLTFHIQPTTFFQVYTEQAEQLLNQLLQGLDLQASDIVVDAYCGVGSLTLPLAQRVQHCIGVDVHLPAIEQAQSNASLNQINNVEFYAGDVALLLPQMAEYLGDQTPDVVVLDPPRKGCDPAVLNALRQLHPPRIAYMSCNPATLARDLKHLCAEGAYRITHVQPADFFPQTAHVECVAFLVA